MAALAILTWTSAADARPPTVQKGFGLGVMVGAPTGLSGKLYLDRSPMAIQFGLGTYHQTHAHDGLHVHGDVLWHPAVLASTPAFDLPFYVGVGARLLDYDEYYDHGHWHNDESRIGVRVPIGLSFDFRRAPLDLFAELVPVWDLVHDHDDFDEHHHSHADLTGALGLRYYF